MKVSIEETEMIQLNLSGKELCVAAAFWEIPVIYGIKSGFFDEWHASPYSQIKETVEAMEMKKYISCGINGTVHMNPIIFQCLKCMESPEWMMSIMEQHKEKNSKYIYLYGKGEHTAVIIEKMRNIFDISFLLNKDQLAKTMSIIVEKNSSIHSFSEKISASLLKELKDMEGFCGTENVKKMIESSVNKDVLSYEGMILAIIENRAVYRTISLSSWENRKRKANISVTYGVWEEKEVVVKATPQGGLELTDTFLDAELKKKICKIIYDDQIA